MMRCRVVAAVFGVLLLAADVMGQTVEVSGVDSPASSNSIFARIDYGRRNDTDIDGPDQLAADDARGEAGGTFVFKNGVRWLNLLGYGYTHYSSEYINAQVHNLSIASIVGIPLRKSGWTVLVGPTLSFSADEGTNWGDAYSVGGLLGATYTASPDLTVGLAIAASNQIEEGVNILPVPMVNWRFAPQWRLYTGITEVAARRGVGGFVEWNVVGPCDVSVGAQFEHRRFRLDEVAGLSTPFSREGSNYVGEDQSVPLYIRANFRLIDGLSADVLTGAVLGGKMAVSTPHDHFVSDAKYDAAFLFGVRLQYTFDDI